MAGIKSPNGNGRKKGDGQGRIGGRVKGTPNKNQPIKAILRTHSQEYFEPRFEERDENGKPTGRLLSQYELDIQNMKPTDRVNAELTLLKFHTPQMQATAVDMAIQDSNKKLSSRLKDLAEGKDISSEEE